MDSLTISAETYAAQFSKCKPGEAVTGTFSGTVGEPGDDGSYVIELNAVTKDEAGPNEEGIDNEAVDATEGIPASASPAARAVLKTK